MYAYLFLFMFTIGAGTAASVGIMNVNNKSHETSKALEDVRIMSLWETNIGDALEYVGPNNELVPPIGVNQTEKNGAQLPPSWVIAPRTNAYGKAILYCPLSKGTAIDSKVPTKTINNQGNNYTANITTYKNKEYVTASDIKLDASIPRASTLAFLISPGADEKPTCSDVLYNSNKGYFYLRGNNGIVRVITPAHKINHGNEEPVPDGEARDISALINDWGKTTGKDLVIDLTVKDYFNNSVAVTKFDSSNTLILRSAAGQSVKLKSNGSSLSLNGVKHVEEGVDTSNLGQLSVENGSLIINNAIMPKVAIASSSMSAYGTNATSSFSSLNANLNFNGSKTSINTPGDNVSLKNSKVNVYNGSTLSIDVGNGKLPLSLVGNSDFYLESATLNLKGSSGYSDAMVLNDATSRFTSTTSTINLNSKSTYGVYSQGLLKFDGSTLYPNSTTTSAIYITDGGKTYIDQSSIGSSSKRALYGVIIDATSFTSGGNTNVYSSYTCLSGSGYNSSKSLPDKTITNIQWTCR